MKKILFLLAAFLVATPAFSQWVSKKVDNKLDLPYKIAYCTSTNQKGLLKLENVGGELAFYLHGTYFCDEILTVEFACVIGEETKRYQITGSKSSDSRTVFLIDNLLDEENSELLSDIKKSSKIVMRVNESHCTSEVYTFLMSGSTSAVNFMSTP
jgi:hypothetical protein